MAPSSLTWAEERYMRSANAQRADLEDQVLQDVGDIVSTNDDRITIACDGATFTARRAVSCLVEPRVGDHVLFAGRLSGDLYVLAVLERNEGAEVVMRVAGDLTLKVDHGRFAVAADEGVDIVSKRRLRSRRSPSRSARPARRCSSEGWRPSATHSSATCAR